MIDLHGKSVTISARGAQGVLATLSVGQKTFNRLIKQIEQKRQQLAAWEAMLPRYQKKYTEEMLPMDQIIQDLQARIVCQLDVTHDKKGLSRRERENVSELIIGLLGNVPNFGDDPALKAIYNRHSGSDFDSDFAQEKQMAKQMLEEMMGVELDDDIDFSDPEAVMRSAQAKMRQKLDLDSTDQETRQPGRKKTAKQAAREEAEEIEKKDISEAIREVYRKLASALHPDREPDAAERARKNDLMQRVNKAYESRNLLQLLELQLELEHIDPAALAELSEDKLKRYNAILKEQTKELDMQLLHVESGFIFRFRIEVRNSKKPETLFRQLGTSLIEKQHAVRDMKRDLLAFSEVNAVKSFLRSMQPEARNPFLDFIF